ncbi:MAG: sulfite exporter TauE/SafE family protein [Rhodobacteraceae bacterium]|nr:sulfite exporter TauE/SafE family protein [Paracoccaceae bacterium]
MADLLLFFVAGFVGGAVNVAAGGAKLFVFPLLLAAGLPPLAANATGTIALWPAQLPGVLIFRGSLGSAPASLVLDALVAMVGGTIGALALIFLGEGTFLVLVPFLLILAVSAILLGDLITKWSEKLNLAGERRWLERVFYFGCGLYAGYFGAGLGFMFLASVLLVSGMGIHGANAKKNLLAVAANTAAVVPLSFSGLVVWPAAITVLLGGLIGGYAGAKVIGKIPERLMRTAIALLGSGLTIHFLIG